MTSYERYLDSLSFVPAVDLRLDISKMGVSEEWLEKMEPAMQRAYVAMETLEGGAIANPDEGRMVGHYWLRAPELAPNAELKNEIESTLVSIKSFVAEVHAKGEFTDVLSIGIGGSALGPMFVADALGHPKTDKLRVWFFDNTDPDGIERTLAQLEGRLEKTLVLVISKSGGTPETANGMKLAEAAFARAGVDFAPRAVAITMAGSKLDGVAKAQGWKAVFPMFDWVGGRTSVLSAVGLLAAALQGFDVDAMLEGARETDKVTRARVTRENPAALTALMWHWASKGRGEKDLVVLPYKDRLLLLSRYLQQLVMESLGKELDVDGVPVEQGLAVYGNKGSTDQHAYVQQLRDGVHNFFVTFVRVLEDGGDTAEMAPGVRAGDFLDGFLLGTRAALSEKGRASMTLTVRRVDARTVGALIALFERAVGFYASLVRINAYHQPGVQAGKLAAEGVLALQGKLLAALGDEAKSVEELARDGDVEMAAMILEHLAANGRASAGPGGYKR